VNSHRPVLCTTILILTERVVFTGDYQHFAAPGTGPRSAWPPMLPFLSTNLNLHHDPVPLFQASSECYNITTLSTKFTIISGTKTGGEALAKVTGDSSPRQRNCYCIDTRTPGMVQDVFSLFEVDTSRGQQPQALSGVEAACHYYFVSGLASQRGLDSQH
jgi:hypothetical protein